MRRRTTLFVAALLALFLCAIAGEILLQARPDLMSVRWQIAHPGATVQEAFVVRPDDELGYLYPVTADTDRHGFHNSEPWPAETSIVFLGDSLLGGAGVGLRGGFTHLVGRALPDERVLNLGLAAAGPERQFRVYRRFASDLHPRLVVAAQYFASDFENDAAYAAWLEQPKGTPFLEFRGAFSAKQQGITEPYIDPMTALRTLRFDRLLEKSRVYSWAADLAHQMRSPYPTRYRAGDGSDMFFDEATVRFAAQPANRQDRRIDAVVDSLRRLRDYVTAQGGEVLVMLIPSREELFAVPPAETTGNLVSHTRERLRDAGFEVLDLYPAIRKSADVAAPFFQHDIHLTQHGNRIVADEFVAWFKARAVAPGRRGGGQ
jgi:hypothetical protein